MSFDYGSQILLCPFCDSPEMIVESNQNEELSKKIAGAIVEYAKEQDAK